MDNPKENEAVLKEQETEQQEPAVEQMNEDLEPAMDIQDAEFFEGDKPEKDKKEKKAKKEKKEKKPKKEKQVEEPMIRKKLVLEPEKHKKDKKNKKDKEVSPIDEKLVLEEEPETKIKTPKKVKPTKYKESQEVSKKLFKNRVKFTNKFFGRLKGKAKGQIDVLIKKDYFDAEQRAKMLLGITEKDYHQQILITVPDSFTNKDDVKYHLEVTKDGPNKLYFDQAYVTILFYGTDALFIYQANIDHRSGYIGHDRAQEFKYEDVITVETVIKYDDDTHPKYSVLNAELTLSNNQKFLIHLRNQRLSDQSFEQSLLSDTERTVLQKLKDRIRASKV